MEVCEPVNQQTTHFGLSLSEKEKTMSKRSIHIAIIEDNDGVREEMELFLRTQGHTAWGVGSAEDFWKQLHLYPVDIVIVNTGLPGEDGFSVVDHLRQMRRHGVIVISARGGQQEHMRGLSLGADLYMVKPVNLASLNDAVTGLWERLRLQTPSEKMSVENEPEWCVKERMLVSPEGETLQLSPQETVLISTLLNHRNSVCSKNQLHDELFGYHSEPDTHRVDVIVSRLRTKAREQRYPLPIRALFGKGLTFIDKK